MGRNGRLPRDFAIGVLASAAATGYGASILECCVVAALAIGAVRLAELAIEWLGDH